MMGCRGLVHTFCADSVILCPAYLLCNELSGAALHSNAAWHMPFGARIKFICSLVGLWVTGMQHMAYRCQPIPASSPRFSLAAQFRSTPLTLAHKAIVS